MSDTQQEVSAKVASKCMDVQFSVISTSPTEVVCEAKMGFGQSFLASLAIGNQYSTPPRQFLRMNIIAIGPNVRVQGSGWIETTMAFGQVQRMVLGGDAFLDQMNGFLALSGGQLPIGTTFPGRLYLGVESGFVPYTVNKKKVGGLQITAISEKEGPAARGGLKASDVIVKIGKRTFNDEAGWVREAARVRMGQPTELTVDRGGELLTINMVAEERPPVRKLLPKSEYLALIQKASLAGDPNALAVPESDPNAAPVEDAKLLSSSIAAEASPAP